MDVSTTTYLCTATGHIYRHARKKILFSLSFVICLSLEMSIIHGCIVS